MPSFIPTSIALKLKYYLFDFWDEVSDARTADLPLVSGGPWKVFSIVLIYLFFVKIFGPRIMRNRKAFDLKSLMLSHNIFLAVGNGLGCLAALLASSFGRDCFTCIDAHSSSPKVHSLQEYVYVYGGWAYFISKFIDFLDTIIFVLRKSHRQVSGLHVFHHSFMPIATYVGVKFIPGGNIVLVPLVNTFIHSIMYTYYALAAAGPEYKKYLWWKKYLTLAQVIQFVVIMCHSLYGLLQDNCSYHPLFHALELFYACVFFALFFHFYQRTYVTSSRTLSKGQAFDERQTNGCLKKLAKIPIMTNNNNNNVLEDEDSEVVLLSKIKSL